MPAMQIQEPSINLLSVVILFGAAQGVFLSLVLARMKTGNRYANSFLVSLLLVFSLGLADGFLSVTYYYVRYPRLIGLEWPLTFAYAPLLYFYVRSLTDPGWRIRPWKLVIHFIPAFLCYLYLIPLFLSDPEAKARAWYFENSLYRNYSPVVDPILALVLIQVAAYILLSLRLLKVHAVTIRNSFSSIEKVSLSWLRGLVFIFLCLASVFVFFNFISQFIGFYLEAQYFEHLLVALFIYVAGYRGIRQPEIFAERGSLPEAQTDPEVPVDLPRPASPAGTPDREADKYKKSSLTSAQSEIIAGRLSALMEREKPYREMELTLPELSNRLEVSSHHLSQVINEKLNKTFFDFVNEYRVRETQAALCSPESDRLSILGIAMDAGFNSKSSFYTAFKKHAGMTPSRFKKQNSSTSTSRT